MFRQEEGAPSRHLPVGWQQTHGQTNGVGGSGNASSSASANASAYACASSASWPS